MQSKEMVVTPGLASQWLERKSKNRRVSGEHVKKLANEMVCGRWELNGVPIIFDLEGKLIDGQHRLEAVVMSGVDIMSVVVFGVESYRAFETIDILCRARNVPQLYEMEGGKNANTKTAIARKLLLWDLTTDKSNYDLYKRRNGIAPVDVLDYIRVHEREITHMYDAVSGSKVSLKSGAGSALMAALIICNRKDKLATLRFIDELTTGANLTENSPVLHLRDRLWFRPERSRTAKWDTEVMALTIKAWNYFVEGRTMKILRWRQDGDRPEFFPVPVGGKSCLKSA